ncbi:MAG: EamA family transporter, partial [Solobacterium sp.]|nr:EamA family transporter [Solobacterium sp.]
MQNKYNEQIGAVLAIAGGIGWGVSGAVGQYLFTVEHMDSHWLVPVRLGLAGILLVLFSLKQYKGLTLRPLKNAEDRRDLLIYGIAGISCCQYFYFRTIQLSSAAIGTILQDLSPIFILLATSVLEHRKPHRLEILAVFTALLGVILLSTHGDFTHLKIPAAALLTGVLLAVRVTIYNVYPKRLLKTYPILILQGWAFLMGSVLFAFLFQAWRYYVPLTSTGMLGILIVVLVGNILAFTCYMQGVKLIGPKKDILYGFSEPLSAALLTVLWFHQPF